MMEKIKFTVCWLLNGMILVLVVMAVSPLGGLLGIRGDLSNYAIPLGVLGAMLAVLAAMTKTTKALKFFLILTGASALCLPVSLFVHDLLFPHFPAEGITFVMVFFVLPVTLSIGILGAAIASIKQAVSTR